MSVRQIQIAQLAVLALIPIPLVLLGRYLQTPPDSMLFGLGQFLEATFAELILTGSCFWLLNKVYRMGPRWSAKRRKITFAASIFSVLILYFANVNILIVLPVASCGMGFATLFRIQRKFQGQAE